MIRAQGSRHRVQKKRKPGEESSDRFFYHVLLSYPDLLKIRSDMVIKFLFLLWNQSILLTYLKSTGIP
jgi:hypothetical protein